MMMRSWLCGMAMVWLLISAGQASADEGVQPDMKPLLTEVQKLVKKYYPDAVVTLKDQTIYFKHNLRKFMIHEPLLSGEWQDAYETFGPQKGGIQGSIQLVSGQYGGQAVVPQAFDKRYFVSLLLAPYSKKLNHHAYVHLDYPRDASKEFVNAFEALINGFEKHVAASTK